MASSLPCNQCRPDTHPPGQPGLRLGPLSKPMLMTKVALQHIRTHTSYYAVNQAWYWGVEADWQQEGIICTKHSPVISLPASGTCACRWLGSTQSLCEHPCPLASPLVAHLTSLSLSPLLPTETPGLPSPLLAHSRLTRTALLSCRCSGLAGRPWG